MLLCLEEGCTCFHHRLLDSMREGFFDEVETLIQKLDNISDTADALGKTLLHYAVEYGNATMVQYLIWNGCNVDAQDNLGVTPSMMAVNKSNVVVAEILFLNNADLFVTDLKGKSTLEICFDISIFYDTYNESLELQLVDHRLILEIMFEKIHKDYLTDKNGITKAVMDANHVVKLAFVVCGDIEIARFMLENGFEINDFFYSVSGYTALHCALDLRRFERVKSLIQLGVNLNVKNNYGYSPLRHYILRDFDFVDTEMEVFKTLLKHSTTLYEVDRDGWTDLIDLFWFGRKNVVKTTLQYGVDTGTSLNGRPLLYVLVGNENIDVDDIIDLGLTIDPNTCDSDRFSVLSRAANVNSASKVEFLLQHGFKIYYYYEGQKYWVLASAAQQRNKEKVVEALLQYGADAQIVYSNGETLVDYLVRNGHNEVSKKIIVAHYAMLEASSSLTEAIRSSIDALPEFKLYFDSCLRMFEKLKLTSVYGTVTLFKLLTENDKKLAVYARNQEFLVSFEAKMEDLINVDPYYMNYLRKRVGKAVEKSKREQRASLIIEMLTGLDTNNYHAIVYKIIAELNSRDIENLFYFESHLGTIDKLQ